jgi:tRNA(adenine34) deaminase
MACAGNRRETLRDPTAHAELLAIREAARVLGSWRLDGCTLYATLEPCAMCAGATILSRVPRCVYAAMDPKGGFLGSVGDLSSVRALNHRFAVERGLLAEESAELLREFFQKLRARENESCPR